MSSKNSTGELVGGCIGIILIIAILTALQTVFYFCVWNYLVVPVFELKTEITWVQALLLGILISVVKSSLTVKSN